jgi:hypothetical protein
MISWALALGGKLQQDFRLTSDSRAHPPCPGKTKGLFYQGLPRAPIYENVGEFNEKTLSFLKRNAG